MTRLRIRVWAIGALSYFGLAVCNGHAEPQRFLDTYCIRCHGEEKQKADRRFDDLSPTITTPLELERYQEIVDALNLQAMPPEDANQPTPEERAALIHELTTRIVTARQHLGDSGGHSVLRRLNAWEYRHTLSDLLGLNVDSWNPAEDFPAEAKRHGFDNNGETLVTSGMLLEKVLLSAEEAIRRSTYFGDQPEHQTYVQKTPFYFKDRAHKHLPKLFQVDRFRFIPDTPYTDLYGRHYRGGHIGFEPLAVEGLPHSGNYTIRVRAAAVGRTHDYDKALGDFRNGDPLVLEIASVDRKGSTEQSGSVSKHVSLTRIELTNEEPEWFQWTGYLEKGFQPEIRFRNGPLSAKRLVRLLSSKEVDRPELQPFLKMKSGMEKAHGVLKAYRGPRLRVWEIQVEGPHVESWPPTGHRVLYGDLHPQALSRTSITTRLEAFATTAFRRPLIPGELTPIKTLVTTKLDAGIEPLTALQLGFQAILCAPGFLYLNEGEGQLDDHALAARLSYFLWASMPDATLRNLAEQGTLHQAATLQNEVDRLLDSPKSQRFVSHFIRRWLELDQIGQMPPSNDFLTYYRDNLGTAMRQETETFFRHILDHNLPVSEFLTADYSFLNRELALHYGIQGIEGSQQQRVSLTGTPRGGLLGQSLFLTASANGVDTNPVIRGIYVLEKILGYTPPPPPPDVPEIEPDIRGAVGIRQQLERHREIATCAECHRKIDPLGFALENFDAVGAWRSHYGKRQAIDMSGRFPSGVAFTTLEEFRNQIIQRQDQFTRNLTEKLLTYALGRELGIQDRPAIDRILHELATKNGGLRDLIVLLVQSPPFGKN